MQRGIAIFADLRRKSLCVHALIFAEQENPNYTPANIQFLFCGLTGSVLDIWITFTGKQTWGRG